MGDTGLSSASGGSSAGAAIGNSFSDTPNLTDSDFSGLTDADIMGGGSSGGDLSSMFADAGLGSNILGDSSGLGGLFSTATDPTEDLGLWVVIRKSNEALSFIKGGLRDISITRTSIKWGVPVPWDADHVFYVWYDALINYLTAIGYGRDDDEVEKWWPHSHHIIGKEIIRFHCVWWPAMCIAAGVGPVSHVQVHGWLLLGGQKLSKTMAADGELAWQVGIVVKMQETYERQGFIASAKDAGLTTMAGMRQIGQVLGGLIRGCRRDQSCRACQRTAWATMVSRSG